MHSQSCLFSLLFSFQKSFSKGSSSIWCAWSSLGRMLLIQHWFIPNFNMPRMNGASVCDHLNMVPFKIFAGSCYRCHAGKLRQWQHGVQQQSCPLGSSRREQQRTVWSEENGPGKRWVWEEREPQPPLTHSSLKLAKQASLYPTSSWTGSNTF